MRFGASIIIEISDLQGPGLGASCALDLGFGAWLEDGLESSYFLQ